MNIDIDIDDGGVGDWLDAAGRKVSTEVRQVVSKGALNVKNTMKADAEGSYFTFSPTIGYDLKGNAGFSEAEVGPEKGGAGSLANIAYFGGAHGGGGTIRDPQQALNEEAPRFQSALEGLVNRVLP